MEQRFGGLRRSALNSAKLSLTTTLNRTREFITKGIPRFFANAMCAVRSFPIKFMCRPVIEGDEKLSQLLKEGGFEVYCEGTPYLLSHRSETV